MKIGDYQQISKLKFVKVLVVLFLITNTFCVFNPSCVMCVFLDFRLIFPKAFYKFFDYA